MSSDPTIHDLASIYAINALEDDERLEFEAHLAGCDPCQAEVAAVNETMAALATESEAEAGTEADSLNAATPTALRANILAAISETEQLPPADTQAGAAVETPSPAAAVSTPIDLSARRRISLQRALPLAAAAVLLIAAASFGFLRSGGSPDDGISVEEVAAASDSIEVDLGPAEGVGGSVKVAWSADLDAVSVTANGLAQPGPGQIYELWFVLEEGVAPAGLFTPEDGSFTGVLEVGDMLALGWGITIEPAQGSDQPTGEILYTAQL